MILVHRVHTGWTDNNKTCSRGCTKTCSGGCANDVPGDIRVLDLDRDADLLSVDTALLLCSTSCVKIDLQIYIFLAGIAAVYLAMYVSWSVGRSVCQ